MFEVIGTDTVRVIGRWSERDRKVTKRYVEKTLHKIRYIKLDENHPCDCKSDQEISRIFFAICKCDITSQELLVHLLQSLIIVNYGRPASNGELTISVACHEIVNDRIHDQPYRLNEYFHFDVRE